MLRRSFLAAGAAGALFAQTSDEVNKAVQGYIAALRKNDIAAVGSYLADDLIYTHSTGLVENKQEFLAKLKTGDQKYDGIRFVKPVFRVFGNTAVLNTQAQFTGSTKGVPFDNTLLMMHVWVKRGNDWKLVAHQTTRKQ